PQVAPMAVGSGALLLPIAIGVAYFSFRRGAQPPQLTLYEQGVVVQRGQEVQLVGYDEIETLWERILWQGGHKGRLVASRTQGYTIQTRDGRTLRLDDQFAGIRQAGELIQQEVLRRNLLAAAAAYQADTPLPFGPVTISRAGLARGKAALPWSEIVRVD